MQGVSGNPEHGRSKAKYFSELALRNFRSARMLWAGEVLGKNRAGLDVWRNVSEHCLVQAAACEVLSEALNLSSESRRNLGLAAMAHDWDKKYQTTGLRKINQYIANGEVNEQEGGKLKYDFFEESESHSVKGMQNRGIPPEIIRIASADGHPALPRVVSPEATLEEKIHHYVGAIIDENNVVSLNKRVDNLERNERYTAMNKYGRQVPWTGGRTLYEVQRDVGHQIEKELVRRLIESENLNDYWRNRLRENPQDLPQFILFKIQKNFS